MTDTVRETLEQLYLPGMSKENGHSYFSDTAFAGNKSEPVHRWVPWIAGFSKDFVRDAIERHIDSPSTVLDPFAGVGTTLVEAMVLGHEAIGFEINPYAALACEVKTRARDIDVELLSQEVLRFRGFYRERLRSKAPPESSSPSGFRTRSDFYSPNVLRKVLTVQDFVESLEDKNIQDLFSLMFASTMVRYSNYSYEPSLSRRVTAGKEEIDDYPVGETIIGKLGEAIKDILWLREQLDGKRVGSRVVNDSFFKCQEYLSAGTVDLIVTSPPYLNNYHYNRNTRPQLYWLGYANRPKDLKPLEHKNFGKYWQTVRGKEFVGLDFSLPTTDIDERLEKLRQANPEKGVYGGNGWANYAATYFNDCYKFALEIDYVLNSRGVALVVIGNSILQGIEIPTDYYFAKIAESIGLELVDIYIPRETRVGNSIIQSDVRVEKARDSHQLYEAVVELRKL